VFDRFVAKIESFVADVVADVVAWRINRYAEKCALALLEQTHLGATPGWLSELVEQRGRHALTVAHH
jgi:hypothetical protein